MSEPQHHSLVQAPIDPVDEDGLLAAYVGTGLSVVATLVLWWQQAWLASIGREWWLWVAVSAVGAGVLFTLYALRRRRRRLARRVEPLPVASPGTVDPMESESVEQ